MNSAASLQPVIRVRHHEEQRRASEYARLAAEQSERERKLQELRGYLREYEARPSDVLDPMLLANQRAFLDRLRSAIRSQEAVVSRAREQLDCERRRWVEARRASRVVDQLGENRARGEQRRALARTQDLMDECALRLCWQPGAAMP